MQTPWTTWRACGPRCSLPGAGVRGSRTFPTAPRLDLQLTSFIKTIVLELIKERGAVYSQRRRRPMNRKTPVRRSGRQPKQDRSRTSLRRLLETAESMLASDGYAQFTLQALRKQAKVSIGSIYNLFESKQALVRELQVRFLERVERVHAQVTNDPRRNNLPLNPVGTNA